MDDHLSRRDFLGAGAVAGAAMLGNTLPSWGDQGTTTKLPTRVFGRTNVRVPILGLGTVALGGLNEKQAVALANRAIDLGVTYIDTAPGSTRQAKTTGYGRAQAHLAGVLRERRKEVFIATKCLETDGQRTGDLLRSNLKTLGIPQVDLCYVHAIGHGIYNFDELVGDKGPIAAVERLRKDGLCRFIGITGHNRPEKFRDAIGRRQIDCMMNAVNIVDRHTYAFEDVVWPAARKQNIGLAAMKVYGGGIAARPCRMPEDLRRASFRFAQSIQGVALTVIGMGSIKELELNVEWARDFKPMTAKELGDLRQRTVALAKTWGVHLDRLDAQGEKMRPLVNT